MFSGVVAGKAKISKIDKKDETIKMTVTYSTKLLSDIKIGDSISLNGTCLTVETIELHQLNMCH